MLPLRPRTEDLKTQSAFREPSCSTLSLVSKPPHSRSLTRLALHLSQCLDPDGTPGHRAQAPIRRRYGRSWRICSTMWRGNSTRTGDGVTGADDLLHVEVTATSTSSSPRTSWIQRRVARLAYFLPCLLIRLRSQTDWAYNHQNSNAPQRRYRGGPLRRSDGSRPIRSLKDVRDLTSTYEKERKLDDLGDTTRGTA